MKMQKIFTLIGVLFFMTVFIAAAQGKDDEDSRDYKHANGVITESTGSSIVLNETLKVYLGYETKFFDSNGRPISNSLEESKCVAIEGSLNPDGSINAEKAYMRPCMVGRKDRLK